MVTISRNKPIKRGPIPYKPIKFKYAETPIAVDEATYSNPILRFLFGWMGIKKSGISRIELSDGQFFQTYPISTMVPDWSHILRGAVDVTGSYWAHINDGKPCLNGLELDGPFTAREGEPMLQRIADYRESGAPLKENPSDWPEPYKSVWFTD
jgi:hypothetical protein